MFTMVCTKFTMNIFCVYCGYIVFIVVKKNLAGNASIKEVEIFQHWDQQLLSIPGYSISSQGHS